jgi:hypothetical protein
MRITRLTFIAIVMAGLAKMLQSFPSEPSERAAVVCRPALLLANVASEISSSMDDSGRIGPTRQPWRYDIHRACLRVAERVFIAAAES